jgi:two-component system heavy metal sensor histidine kinase CusS
MSRLSIRWRIALWNTAAFAVILSGFGLAIYGLLRKTHYDQVDRRMQAQFQELIKRQPNNTAKPADAWLQGYDGAAYILDQEGQVVEHVGKLSADDLTHVDTPTSATPHFNTGWAPIAGHVRRLIAQIGNTEPPRTLVMVAELEHVDEELWEVIRALLITTPITLLAAASIAYLLARKALSPVDQLRQMTDDITVDRLDRRLPIRNSADELGLLAQTINSMIARLERSFGEIRRFTADASHELRTPVAVIRSEAELGLTTAGENPAARRRFESIVEECSRLADLTTQLLALCREEAGVTQTVRAPVRLETLISEATESMRPLATAKGLQLAVKCEADPVVLGDADRLRRVLCNLLDNAIRHTPAGGSVSVTLWKREEEAAIDVRDTGVGIAAEHLPHVFDRFYQVDSGRSQSSGGAGLGLSIVKSIVDAHGGRMEVTSDPGMGSVFRVCLTTIPDTPHAARLGAAVSANAASGAAQGLR